MVFKDETDSTAADYEVTSTWTTASVSKTETSSQILNDLGSPSRWGRDSRQQDISPLDSHLLPATTLPIRGQKLLDLNEAYLLRHFQLVLGSWVGPPFCLVSKFCRNVQTNTDAAQLDVCDPQRHFSVHVVQRAPTSPLLLYACLAIAARQLSLTSGSVLPETADDYHERCVAILLPMLENADFDHHIHILLSSTVILRLFEQISCMFLLNWFCYKTDSVLKISLPCSQCSRQRHAAPSAGGLRLREFPGGLRRVRRLVAGLVLDLCRPGHPVFAGVPNPPETSL